jgi:hypothetical protein
MGLALEPALRKEVRKAIRSALRDQVLASETGHIRGAYVRLAHVGEAAAYPRFTNRLASLIDEESQGKVTPVVYTRHRQARKLDGVKMVINFTIDASSENRKAWVPAGARIVGSAFDGRAIDYAEVNFLEHHRWTSALVKTPGNICPVTATGSKLSTCDEAKCDLCFRKPK